MKRNEEASYKSHKFTVKKLLIAFKLHELSFFHAFSCRVIPKEVAATQKVEKFNQVDGSVNR